MKSRALLLLAFLTLWVVQVKGQWSITAVDTDFTIDFDNTVAGVNEGVFAGSGFASNPTTGQLYADAWAVFGMSDGNKDFGEEATDGDFARGASPGGVTTGGIYAFEVESGNFALGVQPGSSDFTPGWIGLKVQNNTGQTVNFIQFSYDLWVLNDQDRANTFNGEFSFDGSTWQPIQQALFTSPELKDDPAVWEKTTFNLGGFIDVDIADGDYLYFRWYSNDATGGGSRDEFAIDNIVLKMSKTVPQIADIDINSDVVDVTVCQGTSEADAIAALAAQITITDTDGAEHVVDLSWTIDSYDANTPADYTATGTFTLPDGVAQT
ncbi:MAG TPA: hypothetical protein ENN49_06155, partial [Bacteroidales bacterium]|nr:hypothetical protein [Bacteroidales bacterium]